ncbi:hypothetical protein [Phenylobacterium sp.]|uniref:hypothetical protein n=1 Tax=Phenylobacterium sp. TaxID=1871053 RepID=UPI0035ADD046
MPQYIETNFEGVLPYIGEDGRPLRVSLYVDYTVLESWDGSRARLPTSYRLELDDGTAVEKADGDSLRVQSSGEVLKLFEPPLTEQDEYRG